MRKTIGELGLDEAKHLANFASRWQVEQVRIVMTRGQVIGWLQTASTAVTLGVVKTNPARRLYERLGFRVTHEDQYKFYMLRRPDRAPT
jgi:ribosomal protein S18 acetylase RimI-like enzyme